MNEVKKLWYTSEGELRLLKEWSERPVFTSDFIKYCVNDDCAYSERDAIDLYDRHIARIKSESLPVVNAVDVAFSLGHTGKVIKDKYFDLPGATWEERYQRDFSSTYKDVRFESVTKEQYESNEKHGLKAYAQRTVAFIHLPKTSDDPVERGAGDDYQVIDTSDRYIPQQTSDGQEMRNKIRSLNAELAAAHKRIEKLEAWKESEMSIWNPVLNYVQDNADGLGIQPGAQISKYILRLLQETVLRRKGE